MAEFERFPDPVPLEDLPDSETPWTALKGVTRLEVAPCHAPVRAQVMVSGSKSVSNRALILAGLAEGDSTLCGILKADDTWWCIDALRRLGVEVAISGTDVHVRGIGRTRPRSGRLHLGSAGTLSRFLPPMLAAGEKGEWMLSASRQMSGRPVGPLFAALRAGGGRVDCLEADDRYPARVFGASFAGGRITMSGAVSSQFISGILMGAGESRGGVELAVTGGIVQSEYVRITLDMMAHFGGQVEATDDFSAFRVASTGYRAKDLVVEADASTATYFAALAAVTGGRITLANLGSGTRQPDYGFLDILERMGCRITRTASASTIEMKGKLRGGFSIDMRPLSDATLTLAALAPFSDGPVHMHSVAHIRHHECDRISAMCASLDRMGIRVEEHADGMTVYPGTPERAVLDTFEDHRMAMSLAIVGIGGKGVELLGPGCVSKTCPQFFDQMEELGIGIRR